MIFCSFCIDVDVSDVVDESNTKTMCIYGCNCKMVQYYLVVLEEVWMEYAIFFWRWEISVVCVLLWLWV
jgi:hypothetical protein